MTLPNEWDNEVGGVLTMLLEPPVVDTTADETEDEDEDVDGVFSTRVGTAVIPFDASICVNFCWEITGSLRGADADKQLGTLGALELKLAAVPPINEANVALLDLVMCIWAM